ncbi:hypothetical protein CISG_06022 [Coccidioides immitis RMSCC 3703]|uniref:Uncharacterized protein n=2 Tax=Coccidioides immitis TaxID=5501 RepID=A0A0J8R0L1_COCIT|nr:hypothetical protein CIRG_02482 [Coccidioides immitis RMSCC 2394]KMU77178.1 hypothetical protein CISG_06022 [Coccidioides immitis RMSCC 3703]
MVPAPLIGETRGTVVPIGPEMLVNAPWHGRWTTSRAFGVALAAVERRCRLSFSSDRPTPLCAQAKLSDMLMGAVACDIPIHPESYLPPQKAHCFSALALAG